MYKKKSDRQWLAFADAVVMPTAKRQNVLDLKAPDGRTFGEMTADDLQFFASLYAKRQAKVIKDLEGFLSRSLRPR